MPVPLKYHRYYRNDTNFTWVETGLNHWSVSGGGTVPAISQDVQGSFPVFTGSLPATVDTNTDLAFTFNSGNISNGDSAYIAIYGNGNIFRSSPVSAQGGVAMISSNYIKNTRSSMPLYIRTKEYNSALLMAVVYKYEIININNVPIVFVRQKQVVRTVTLN